MLFGCDVEGFSNFVTIERIHLNFLNFNYLLNLKHSTPDFIVYGEFGSLIIKTRIITYWSKMNNGNLSIYGWCKNIEKTLVGL